MRKGRPGGDPVDRVYGKLRLARPVDALLDELRGPRPAKAARPVRTAVDTSVLLDVLGADATHGEPSREALRGAYRAGALVVCDLVWAEIRAHFRDEEDFRSTLDLLGVCFDAVSAAAAALAGRLWRQHRARSRAARTRVVADLLIGAHARLRPTSGNSIRRRVARVGCW